MLLQNDTLSVQVIVEKKIYIGLDLFFMYSNLSPRLIRLHYFMMEKIVFYSLCWMKLQDKSVIYRPILNLFKSIMAHALL